MKVLTTIVLLHLCNMGLVAQKVLYNSDAYTVTLDRVIQGEFEARALSRKQLISNYKSMYKTPTRKTMVFKFSINGFDNERFPGEDHHAILSSKNEVHVSPVYKFGFPDPEYPSNKKKNSEGFLEEDIDFVIRVDMRHVLEDFKIKGFYVTATGEKITAENFDGVFVAGGTIPLTWDFRSLPNKPQFKLNDNDGDGIFDVTIKIKKFQQAEELQDESATWSLNEDISRYPE